LFVSLPRGKAPLRRRIVAIFLAKRKRPADAGLFVRRSDFEDDRFV
jgi:hypothetical protein